MRHEARMMEIFRSDETMHVISARYHWRHSHSAVDPHLIRVSRKPPCYSRAATMTVDVKGYSISFKPI